MAVGYKNYYVAQGAANDILLISNKYIKGEITEDAINESREIQGILKNFRFLAARGNRILCSGDKDERAVKEFVNEVFEPYNKRLNELKQEAKSVHGFVNRALTHCNDRNREIVDAECMLNSLRKRAKSMEGADLEQKISSLKSRAALAQNISSLESRLGEMKKSLQSDLEKMEKELKQKVDEYNKHCVPLNTLRQSITVDFADYRGSQPVGNLEDPRLHQIFVILCNNKKIPIRKVVQRPEVPPELNFAKLSKTYLLT